MPHHVNMPLMPHHSSMIPAVAVQSTPDNQSVQVAGSPQLNPLPTDSLIMLLQRYPVMWQGVLALKTDQAAVQMHFVFGNPKVAGLSLPYNTDGSTPPLRIAQRMRLDETQLEGVARKIQVCTIYFLYDFINHSVFYGDPSNKKLIIT